MEESVSVSSTPGGRGGGPELQDVQHWLQHQPHPAHPATAVQQPADQQIPGLQTPALQPAPAAVQPASQHSAGLPNTSLQNSTEQTNVGGNGAEKSTEDGNTTKHSNAGEEAEAEGTAGQSQAVKDDMDLEKEANDVLNQNTGADSDSEEDPRVDSEKKEMKGTNEIIENDSDRIEAELQQVTKTESAVEEEVRYERLWNPVRIEEILAECGPGDVRLHSSKANSIIINLKSLPREPKFSFVGKGTSSTKINKN